MSLIDLTSSPDEKSSTEAAECHTKPLEVGTDCRTDPVARLKTRTSTSISEAYSQLRNNKDLSIRDALVNTAALVSDASEPSHFQTNAGQSTTPEDGQRNPPPSIMQSAVLHGYNGIEEKHSNRHSSLPGQQEGETKLSSLRKGSYPDVAHEEPRRNGRFNEPHRNTSAGTPSSPVQGKHLKLSQTTTNTSHVASCHPQHLKPRSPDSPAHNTPPAKTAQPAQKVPSFVEEVTKVNFPSGFSKVMARVSQSSEEQCKSEDEESPVILHEKLGAIFLEAGGAEQSGIYETWSNPDATSCWLRVKKTHKELPPVMPPASSGSSSDSSESLILSPSNCRGRRKRALRSQAGPSVVTDVYADTRYFDVLVTSKKAKLIQQSRASTKNMAPLDWAQFRDFKVLPIDHFVKEMKEMESKARNENIVDSSQSGKPRRRRQIAQEAEDSQQRSGKKTSGTSVRVGWKYQATLIPRAQGKTYRADSSNIPRSDQIWDPKKAEAAIRNGEDIEGFLAQSRELVPRALLMESLHRADYSCEGASRLFPYLFAQARGAWSNLSDKDVSLCHSLFERERKDFYDIAERLGESVSTVMVNYYKWKGVNQDDCYTRMKQKWKMEAESDMCYHCEDGGDLIVCDHCHRAYHLGCLKPPLKEVPEVEVWYCFECLKSPAKLRHLPSISGSSAHHVASKPEARKALGFD